MPTFDSNGPVPLYYQLRRYISDRIESGELKPGDRLPSESKLVSRFGISRTTVRQALGELTSLGLLTRIQGKGTFVVQPRIQQRLSRLTGFSQDMHSRRLRPSSQILDLALVHLDGRIADRLGVPPNSEAVFLRRLRLADSEPMAIEISYLLNIFFDALRSENLAERSLYEVLKQNCATIPTRAAQEMEAIPCPATEAALLGIRKGSPVLHIHRTSYDQTDHPFEQVESFYRGDRYVFYAELAN